MNKICVTLAILVSLLTIVNAQEKTPDLLHDAVKCLSMENNFYPTDSKSMTFGYLMDNKSYPGEKVLYVVRYMPAEGSDNFVFSLFLEKKNNLEIFNIQNNAKYNWAPNGIGGINFVDPPLGGVWTQGHLASAIRQIEKRRRFTVPISDVTKGLPSLRCDSYADH